MDIASPADPDSRRYKPVDIAEYDAVFLSGSPMHVYHETAEVDRQLDFMRAVFASGVPSFGSCAGLQVAAAAAGGQVRQMPQRMEAGIARRISATISGRRHPLLAGRPRSWIAPAIHGDEVESLPEGATVLASNSVTEIQAAEIRFHKGIFWGVQYHPELALGEIAVALRAQANDLVEAGLANTDRQVFLRAEEIEALHENPQDRTLYWRIGIDEQFAVEEKRRRELVNFLNHAPCLRQ